MFFRYYVENRACDEIICRPVWYILQSVFGQACQRIQVVCSYWDQPTECRELGDKRKLIQPKHTHEDDMR